MDSGDLDAMLSVLAPEAVWIGDGGAKVHANRRTIHGSDRIARGLIGFSHKFAEHGIQRSIEDVNGMPTVIERKDGTVFRVIAFGFDGEQITSVQALLNPDKFVKIS